MNCWLWILYFLPVSGTLKVLPEVQLDVEWGGSTIIECPLPKTPARMYLCRQRTDPGICTTVVSNTFVNEEYKERVTLKPCLDRKLFLVEMTWLTENDNGIYACGVGPKTDRGKTQKVILNVHNEYPEPFWEEEQTPEPPRWLRGFLQPHIPWLPMSEHDSSSGVIAEVTTPPPKTEAPPDHHPSSLASVTHQPRLYEVFSESDTKSPELLPDTTASKTSTQQAIRPLEASYSHHTRLHGQRTLNHGPQYGREDRGLHIPIPEFHILIPTFLGFLLLVLLGLMVKTAIQRRRATSRRAGRLAMRMRGRGASRPFPAQRRDASQKPRSQNNVYSACPRRARGPDSVGPAEVPLLNAPASAFPAQPQVLEVPWTHAPSLKMSCEYVTLGHPPAVDVEDPDSDDYINVPGPSHLPCYPPGLRYSCQ
ncbi:fas apoptotic inhibitory molecule 3 isoform X2 [Apodemus sylvaticus]|uniref:fas apoptotic inhibitory molecule 3 isoform X2 n=1 Tax=Apodemus sylvaticus TaxID=10129 RepID=UPI0022429121|nr:fas apoptotic inhibitory molecule 3 isoform X2 [Apodemus sylvaticus]